LQFADVKAEFSVEELAKKKNASMAQIAMAWSMGKEGTPRTRFSMCMST
jgi:aryl-alcohol dehydrogenase-like predicted oxidoreductase